MPSLPGNVVEQLRSLIQQNVNRHFGTLTPAEKTPDKVRDYAQKQLDFFISGIARESLELRQKWAKGHPFHAHLRMKPHSTLYEIEINCDEQ